MFPVTVIVVTYNSAAVIVPCLKSVKDAAHIIVVDNNSQDDTLKLVKRHFPKAKCLANNKNLGFGCANNLALKKVTTPFSLLLNPDATIEKNALACLVESAGNYPDAAILSPCLLEKNGDRQENYKRVIFVREKMRRPINIPTEGDVCAEFLSGAVMLLRMEHCKKIGFFDPDIFLYYEDDDLCIRTKQAGFSLVWVEKAKAVHLCGQSSPPSFASLYRKNWHMVHSRLYLEKKYQGDMAAMILQWKLLFYYWGKTFLYATLLNKEKTARSLARMMGALGGKSGML